MSAPIYIRGFPDTYTAKDLKNIFKVYGRIRKCQVFSDNAKLYSIVRYYNPDNGVKAIEGLNTQLVDGITWFVAICEKKNNSDIHRIKYSRKVENYKKTIFVKDFLPECNEEMLREIFQKYGRIGSVKINQNTAYVTFTQAFEAKAAIKEKNLISINGNKVYVSKLYRKEIITSLIARKKYRKIDKKLEEKREKLTNKMFAKYQNNT